MDIGYAVDSWRFWEKQSYFSLGIMVGLAGPIVDAVQTGVTLVSAARKTDDARVQGLAVLAGGLYGYNMYNKYNTYKNYNNSNKANASAGDADTSGTPGDAGSANPSVTSTGDVGTAGQAAEGAGNAAKKNQNSYLSLTISIVGSGSTTETITNSDTVVGSSIAAGGNIDITATDGDITVRGSDITAIGDVVLSALKGDILLAAAANTYRQRSSSFGIGGSAGIVIGLGDSDSDGYGYSFSGVGSRGNSSGNGIFWNNTYVSAGGVLTLESGGDTTLLGATAAGDRVIASVVGDLNIISLQNTDTYNESELSHSGWGGSGGGSFTTKDLEISSDYRSVTEQSAIRAGDGGFQVEVGGNTDLQGGAITSTQAAVDSGVNSFTTASLTMSDINNYTHYRGRGIAVTIGDGRSGVGLATKEGDASSVTRAGISDIAGNSGARTGDPETGIDPIFDLEQFRDDLGAGLTASLIFNQQARQAVNNQAYERYKELAERMKKAEAAKDDEEKARIRDEIYQLRREVQWTNAIIGVMSGYADVAVTLGLVSEVGELLTRDQIKSSLKFIGLRVAETGEIISNATKDSAGGWLGYLIGLGGGRIDLINWCDKDRCIPSDEPTSAYADDPEKGRIYYKVDDGGYVIFNPGLNQDGSTRNVAEFLASLNPEEKDKMISTLGGSQPGPGQISLFGLAAISYERGDFWDHLVEAYAGAHDWLNSFIWYDTFGNARHLAGTWEGRVGTLMNWTNVLLATPFAAANLFHSNVWNTLGTGK